MPSRQVRDLPPGLAQFVEPQPEYRPAQHAAWRYIRRVGHPYYQQHAHPAYLDTIRLLEIEMDTIPRISDYDRILDRFHFGAVGVNGFIPPLAFMNFQARGILPISTDMRIPENIAYTPSPDIVHEGFGHVSMLADPAYREILKTFGRLGAVARPAPEDEEYYEAVRHLSIVSEDPRTSAEVLERARERLARADEAASRVCSDARRLTALYWFTVEYGLVRDPQEPERIRIWGAGLISSIGEGRECLKPHVEKVRLALGRTDVQKYDITRPQPVLFVADSFEHVLAVLEEFESTMEKRTPLDVNTLKKSPQRTVEFVPTEAERRLDDLYQQIRDVRMGRIPADGHLVRIWQALRAEHPDDWLAPLEVLELLRQRGQEEGVQAEIRAHLEAHRRRSAEHDALITDGLRYVAGLEVEPVGTG